MSQQAIFVETSVQVRRFLGGRAAQETLETQLSASSTAAFTTNYVWMEFQRTVVADFANIQRLMLQQPRWGDLFSHLLDGSRSFQPRSAVRCTKIVGLLHNQCEGDWDYAYSIVTGAIEGDLERRFWMHVTRQPDPINCDLVNTGTNAQPDGSYTVAASCRKERAACSLPAFLTEKQTKLNAIKDYLAAHSNAIKGQDRVTQLLTAILSDPRAALGQASCWPLGDLIIALQVPAGAVIWTLDSDFAAFASALGLQHANPLVTEKA